MRSWPTRHWQKVFKESLSKENYFHSRNQWVHSPPTNTTATELVVLHFMKQLIKSLTLAAE